MRMWYLPISSIAGAATSFDFSSLFRLGGYLVAMVNWTVSNAYGGMDEQAAFVTSEGEVAVYKGTDPASTATFGQVGHFRIGRPIGPRGFARIGLDMVAICADGVVSFSKAASFLESCEQVRIITPACRRQTSVLLLFRSRSSAAAKDSEFLIFESPKAAKYWARGELSFNMPMNWAPALVR